MANDWSYISGDWNIICDVCSRKIKASKSKKRWDGFIVCPECYEPRHSLDFIRARADKISVPFTRPAVNPNDETFIGPAYISVGAACTPSGSQAIPNLAVPGCMIPNYQLTGL